MNYTKFEEILLWVGGVENPNLSELLTYPFIFNLSKIKEASEKLFKVLTDNKQKEGKYYLDYKL